LDSRPYKILIVDDEDSIALLLSEILKLWNHQTLYKQTVDDALKALKSEKFDVIITDMLMPEMQGDEFMEKVIREDPYYRNRFVFTTGLSINHINTQEKFLYLEKPFKIKDVKGVLEQIERLAI
jgi:DNA-binding NtrC family response regulator